MHFPLEVCIEFPLTSFMYITQMASMFFTRAIVHIFHWPNLNRKAHLSLSPMANLTLRWTFAHPAPSVFHADECGMRNFLMRIRSEARHRGESFKEKET